MRKRLLFCTIIALSLTACGKSAIIVDNDDQPQPNSDQKIKLGTVSPIVFQALGIEGKRTLLSGFGKDGNFTFFGRSNTKFNLENTKPRGTLIRSLKVNVYQDSPTCFHIDPGDGTAFWYPFDCPK